MTHHDLQESIYKHLCCYETACVIGLRVDYTAARLCALLSLQALLMPGVELRVDIQSSECEGDR